jgi:hypothetical protein
MTWTTDRGFLILWSLVGLGLLVACMLALFGPFGQIQCTRRPAPTHWAQQLARPAPLGGHSGGVVSCSNSAGYPWSVSPRARSR